MHTPVTAPPVPSRLALRSAQRLARWAPVYARLALGAAFLSAVASRLGLWSGEPAAQRFAAFVRYTAEGKRFASEGFRHLGELERRFEKEFGADYEATRTVLERVVGLLAED